jgi:hypothetical protein
MERHMARFRLVKATKNTIRFQEIEVEGVPPIIGALYIQKWAVGDQEEIEVTVGPLGENLGGEEPPPDESTPTVRRNLAKVSDDDRRMVRPGRTGQDQDHRVDQVVSPD